MSVESVGDPLFARQDSADVINSRGFRTLRLGMVSVQLPEMHSFVHLFMQHVIIDHLPSTVGGTMMNKTEWAMPS